MLGLVVSLASAPVFAQSAAPAVEAAPAEAVAAPAAQPVTPATAAAAKAKAAKTALLIAGGVAVGAAALDNADKSDDRPSSP